MKKNLKIVSAAAAALLAVAPVAATAVTANADVVFSNGGSTTTPTAQKNQVSVKVDLGKIVAGTTTGAAAASYAENHITVQLNGQNVNVQNGAHVEIQDSTGTAVTGALQPGTQYTVKVTDLKLNNFNYDANKSYTAVNGTLNTASGNNGVVQGSDLVNSLTYTDTFMVPTNKSGRPYVATKATTGAHSTPGKVQRNLKLKYSDASSVTDVVNKFNDLEVKSTGDAGAVPFDSTAIRTAVEAALKAADVQTTGTDGSFHQPVTDVNFDIKIMTNNGQTAEFPVTLLGSNTPAASDAPVFKAVSGAPETNVDSNNNSADLKLDLNSTTTAKDIANNFTAQINGSDSTTTDISVDSSNLNTAVAGKYKVVLSATNPAGKTTKFTVNVTVGNPGDTRYVNENTAKIYNINGNNVTDSNKTLAKGAKVATFGTVSVNGTSYTRLNSADSHDFVLTSALSETNPTPESNKHVRVWNKKESYIYNEHHVRLGNGLRYKIGSGHNVVANENGTPKEYTIAGGVKAYKLSDGYFKGQYVDVRNFTTKRVNNNHKKAVIRSRVFDVRGKVVKHMYINKGATIKVYGTKTIKGHKMYKIAKHNRYVKVANFR